MTSHKRSDTYPIYLSLENTTFHQKLVDKDITLLEAVLGEQSPRHAGMKGNGAKQFTPLVDQSAGDTLRDTNVKEWANVELYSGCTKRYDATGNYYENSRKRIMHSQHPRSASVHEGVSWVNMSYDKNIEDRTPKNNTANAKIEDECIIDERLRDKISKTLDSLMNCSKESCTNAGVEFSKHSIEQHGPREKIAYNALVTSAIIDKPLANLKYCPRQYTKSMETCLFSQPLAYSTPVVKNDKEEVLKAVSSDIIRFKSSQGDFFTRPMPFPVSRRISAQLWAIQVAEGKSSSIGRLPFAHLILVAKVFRVWYLKLRVRRLIKEEQNNKLRRAVKLHRDRVLCKSFIAWREFVRKTKRRKIKAGKLLSRHNDTAYSKKDLKEKLRIFKRKQTQRLISTYFAKWSESKCQHGILREHLLLQKPIIERQSSGEETSTRGTVNSESYASWKNTYMLEQRSGIATLHFKVHLLLKSFHQWRMFTAERKVRSRMKDVGRIHIEQLVLRRAFMRWKQGESQLAAAKNQINRSVLAKAFVSWRTRTLYTRVCRQRCITAIREKHGKKILTEGFAKWKRTLLLHRFLKDVQIKRERRAFMVWVLRHTRAILHRKLYRAQSRKARKKRFFLMWKKYSTESKERRERFHKAINHFFLRIIIRQWKAVAGRGTILRSSSDLVHQKHSKYQLRAAFTAWKFRMDIVLFKAKIQNARTRRAVRQAAGHWKGILKTKKLEMLLESEKDAFKLLKVKGVFNIWKGEYQTCVKNELRAYAVRNIINKGKLARAFLGWHIVTHEDCIISPLLQRVRRRQIAKTFDSWRLIIVRKHVSFKFQEIRQRQTVTAFFSEWSQKFFRRRRALELQRRHENSVLETHLSEWQDFVAVKTERRQYLARKYGTLWRTVVTKKIDERDAIIGSGARDKVLVASWFRVWRLKSIRQMQERESLEATADEFGILRMLLSAIKRWKKRHLIYCNVSHHLESKKKSFLRTVFIAWRAVVNEQLQQSVNGFKDKLQDHLAVSNGSSTLRSSHSSASLRASRLQASGVFGSAPNLFQVHPNIQSPRIATVKALGSIQQGGSLPRNWQRTWGQHRAQSPLSFRESPRSLYRRSPRSIQSQGVISGDDYIMMNPVIVPPRFSQTPAASVHSDEGSTTMMRTASFGSQSPPEKPDIMRRTLPFLCSQRSVEDDTLLTSGIHSNSGYDDDESDDDTVSYGSYQTQSEFGLTREAFVADTLRHWKFLPLSITFRAWLKYTQERRMHGELFFHFVEKKNQRMLQKFFYGWHRETYCKVVAAQFQRHMLLKKGLLGLSDFATGQKTQHSRQIVAELHCRNGRLQYVFSKWKKQFVARRRLQHMINRWQKAAVSSEVQKTKCNQFADRTNNKLLIKYFTQWKETREKCMIALSFYENKTGIKAIKHWRKVALREKEHTKKLRELLLNFLVAKHFYTWQSSLERSRTAEENAQLVQRNHTIQIVRSWHLWAKSKKTLSSMKLEFQKQQSQNLLTRLFCRWIIEFKNYQNAARHYDCAVVQRVFEAWQFYADQKIDKKVKVTCFKKAEGIALLHGNFEQWKRLTLAVHFQKAKEANKNELKVSKLFALWRLSTLKRKAQQILRAKQVALVFRLWRKEYRETQRIQLITIKAFCKWRSFKQGCMTMQKDADLFLEEKNHSVVKESFKQWIDFLGSLRFAKTFYQRKLATRALRSWCERTRYLRQIKVATATVKTRVERGKMALCLGIWYTYYKRMCRNEVVLVNYTELKKQELLQLCIRNLRKNALKCKGERFGQQRLLKKMLYLWSTRKHQKICLKQIRRNLMCIMVRGKIRSWKAKINDISRKGRLANEEFNKKRKRILRKVFDLWINKARKQRIAHNQYRMKLLQRSFALWRKGATKTRHLRNLLAQYENQRNKVRVANLFEVWKQTADARQEQRKRDEVREIIAADHHRKKTLEYFFESWRKDIIIGRMLKRRQKRLGLKYIRLWINNTLVSREAIQWYEQRLYEKYWMQWRRQLIKHQVTGAMVEHDRKKLMSEVFAAWHSFAFLRRGLAKEVELNRTRKYFRKWMQVYNNS